VSGVRGVGPAGEAAKTRREREARGHGQARPADRA
jgi:hypothetical protein